MLPALEGPDGAGRVRGVGHRHRDRLDLGQVEQVVQAPRRLPAQARDQGVGARRVHVPGPDDAHPVAMGGVGVHVADRPRADDA